MTNNVVPMEAAVELRKLGADVIINVDGSIFATFSKCDYMTAVKIGILAEKYGCEVEKGMSRRSRI